MWHIEEKQHHRQEAFGGGLVLNKTLVALGQTAEAESEADQQDLQAHHSVDNRVILGIESIGQLSAEDRQIFVEEQGDGHGHHTEEAQCALAVGRLVVGDNWHS